MGVCKHFTVFLIATDFRTSASRTTTTSQTLHCVLGMQTTQGKTGTMTFHSHSRTGVQLQIFQLPTNEIKLILL